MRSGNQIKLWDGLMDTGVGEEGDGAKMLQTKNTASQRQESRLFTPAWTFHCIAGIGVIFVNPSE